ncbi:TetR/AcrR family transcriptional regulator [Microbacterium gorillae]|uniref:TetR/AcrR family transcriptional regulator n=1 Tax=Microbacterium gorillae TaxID=1231063 RepID=UPI0005909115|nr:TetR/AcrR family transcriptional regulator [Microbacterium gorillae]
MGRPRSFDEDTVLERAMDAFWTNGYAATSPADLAEATGIAKGSLYNAFEGKQQLFDRCLDVYQQHIEATAMELLAAPGSTRDVLRAALLFIVETDLAAPVRRGCLIGNTAVELAGHDAALADRLRRLQSIQNGWFRERIERGQVEGDVRRDADAGALADFLSTALAGLRVMAMTQDERTLRRIVDTTLAVI